jgi:hypothetical protein
LFYVAGHLSHVGGQELCVAIGGHSPYKVADYSYLPPTMLDYVKMILLKVSFSKKLFEKELRKALQQIQPADLVDFKTWCYQQFARLYRRVLKRVFVQHSAVPRLAS